MKSNFFQDAFVLFVIVIIVLLVVGSSFALFWFFQKRMTNLHKTIIHKQNETEVETKQNIAYILHEEVAKSITFTIWNLNKIRKVLSEKEEDADLLEALDYCTSLEGHANDAKNKVTNLHQTIFPPALLVLEFQEACNELISKLQTEFEGEIAFKHSGDFTQLSKTTRYNLYGLINLFITNSIRHSESTKIVVLLEKDKKMLSLQLVDNGKGFDMLAAERTAKGRGVFDIKSRAISLLPTSFNYMSEKGKGTSLKIVLETED